MLASLARAFRPLASVSTSTSASLSAAHRRCMSASRSGHTDRSFHSTPRWQEHFPDADIKTFKNAISSVDKVVLVDFYADWCMPCKMLSPILGKLTTDPKITSGSGLPLDLVTVDTDNGDGFELGQTYRVRALPTVIAFRNGKPVDQFTGALNEAGVREFLEKV